MKKKNQVFILLIVLFLAIVLFLYYTRKLKITEGVDEDTEDAENNDDTGDAVDEADAGDEGDAEDEGQAVDTKDFKTSRSLKKQPEKSNKYYSEGQSKGNIITGEYIPMSSKNLHSVSTVVQDLENDFDKSIPIINNEGKRLSQRLNALSKRVASIELLKSVQSTKTAKPT
jgi:hypothetical protein